MIYLDNAATSWPKPKQVSSSIIDAIENKGGNPGRSGHKMSLSAGNILDQTRFSISKLFNISDMNRIAFTLNATDAINLALSGICREGDHVITSTMEHNSVTRPLEYLKNKGVQITKVKMDPITGVSIDDIKKCICDDTKLIVMTHASNVTGTVNPISRIAELCKEHSLLLLIDASQSAGSIEIDIEKTGIDLLAFPGHKNLFGPMGTGALYIADGVNVEPSRYGGTGIYSEMPLQPKEMPYYYESGTQNAHGLAGLNAGIEFILDNAVNTIHEHEIYLAEKLITGLKSMDEIKIYGPGPEKERTGVVSFNIDDLDCADVAAILDTSFDIAVRAGLHCAPDAHRALGTFDMGGTVRVSPGYFNIEEDIDKFLYAVSEIVKGE